MIEWARRTMSMPAFTMELHSAAGQTITVVFRTLEEAILTLTTWTKETQSITVEGIQYSITSEQVENVLNTILSNAEDITIDGPTDPKPDAEVDDPIDGPTDPKPDAEEETPPARVVIPDTTHGMPPPLVLVSLGLDKLLVVDLKEMGNIMGLKKFAKDMKKPEMARKVELQFRWAFSKDNL
jgi:hypothetical protein